MKLYLQELIPEILNELEKICLKDRKLTLQEALKRLEEDKPLLLQELGTIHEDGRVTRTEVTDEGVNIKELDFEKEINKLLK